MPKIKFESIEALRGKICQEVALGEVGDADELPTAKMAGKYGLNRVRFAAPVPAGERVRARIARLGIEAVNGSVQMRRQVQIEVEGSPKPACIAETLVRHDTA
jgi:acyl dehydratase